MNTEILRGKCAFVSGASSGIGRAIVLALLEHGAKVAVSARRIDRLQDLDGAVPFPADFSDESQITSAIDNAAKEFGGLDILVNSAGLALQAKLSDGVTSDWKQMLDVNVLGLAIASREALTHFPETGGQIVNLCSMSGHRVPGKGGFYAATKFAVRAMTEGLRQELRAAGNQTRVSQLSPGFVDTELLDIYFGGSGANRYGAVDYEMLKPEDIAATVLHVLTAPQHMDVTDVLIRPTEQKT